MCDSIIFEVIPTLLFGSLRHFPVGLQSRWVANFVLHTCVVHTIQTWSFFSLLRQLDFVKSISAELKKNTGRNEWLGETDKKNRPFRMQSRQLLRIVCSLLLKKHCATELRRSLFLLLKLKKWRGKNHTALFLSCLSGLTFFVTVTKQAR